MRKVTALAASGIKQEEDFTGFVVRHCELSNVANYNGVMELMGKKNHRASFVHPSRIERISAMFSNLLPDWNHLIMNHTRYALNSAFLSQANKQRLLRHYRGGEEVGADRLVGMNNLSLRGRLGICPSCVESDLDLHGFAIWHRVHLMPSIHYCPTHAEPLMTFCQYCELGHRRARGTWFPRKDCLCGKPLRQIAQLTKGESAAAAIAISRMAEEVLNGRVDTSLLAEHTASVLRAVLQRTLGTRRNNYQHVAKQFLENRLGIELSSALGFGSRTFKRAMGLKTDNGPLNNPIQNIAAIWSVFKGWPDFLHEVQSRQSNTAAYDECAAPVPVRPRVSWRAELSSRFGALNATQLEEQRACCRKEILAAITVNPNLTRTSLADLPGWRKQYLFATRFDTSWFGKILPSRKRKGFSVPNARNEEADDQDTVSLIFGRYEQAIRERPERFISLAFLLTGTANESAQKRRPKNPVVEAALVQCIDTRESWLRRQIENVMAHAKRIDPKSRWAKRETFEGANRKNLRNRLFRARTWLQKNQD